jgi:hypothetical protein
MFMGHCNSEKGGKHGPRFILRVLGGITLAIGFALVFGIFVQMLWNWLMPPLFKLGTITYAEAFGLMILARLVFGGCGHHRGGQHGPGWGHRGFPRLGWHGCDKTDAANGDIKDWQHYDAWWQEQGRDAFKKYSDSQGQFSKPELKS